MPPPSRAPAIRTLILDWSGTLVDDFEAVRRTTNWVLEQCGFSPLSGEAFRSEFCLPVARFYERHAPGVPVERLSSLFWKKFPEFSAEIRLLPYALDLLKFCQTTGIPVLLATSVDQPTYETHARRLGVIRYVLHAYTGLADKTQALPTIVARHRLDPEQTLFAGDMEHDIEAGHAARVLTCALLTGYTPADRLRAAKPDFCCDTLADLLSLLTQTNPQTECAPSVPIKPGYPCDTASHVSRMGSAPV